MNNQGLKRKLSSTSQDQSLYNQANPQQPNIANNLLGAQLHQPGNINIPPVQQQQFPSTMQQQQQQQLQTSSDPQFQLNHIICEDCNVSVGGSDSKIDFLCFEQQQKIEKFPIFSNLQNEKILPADKYIPYLVNQTSQHDSIELLRGWVFFNEQNFYNVVDQTLMDQSGNNSYVLQFQSQISGIVVFIHLFRFDDLQKLQQGELFPNTFVIEEPELRNKMAFIACIQKQDLENHFDKLKIIHTFQVVPNANPSCVKIGTFFKELQTFQEKQQQQPLQSSQSITAPVTQQPQQNSQVPNLLQNLAFPNLLNNTTKTPSETQQMPNLLNLQAQPSSNTDSNANAAATPSFDLFSMIEKNTEQKKNEVKERQEEHKKRNQELMEKWMQILDDYKENDIPEDIITSMLQVARFYIVRSYSATNSFVATTTDQLPVNNLTFTSLSKHIQMHPLVIIFLFNFREGIFESIEGCCVVKRIVHGEDESNIYNINSDSNTWEQTPDVRTLDKEIPVKWIRKNALKLEHIAHLKNSKNKAHIHLQYEGNEIDQNSGQILVKMQENPSIVPIQQTAHLVQTQINYQKNKQIQQQQIQTQLPTPQITSDLTSPPQQALGQQQQQPVGIPGIPNIGQINKLPTPAVQNQSMINPIAAPPHIPKPQVNPMQMQPQFQQQPNVLNTMQFEEQQQIFQQQMMQMQQMISMGGMHPMMQQQMQQTMQNMMQQQMVLQQQQQQQQLKQQQLQQQPELGQMMQVIQGMTGMVPIVGKNAGQYKIPFGTFQRETPKEGDGEYVYRCPSFPLCQQIQGVDDDIMKDCHKHRHPGKICRYYPKCLKGNKCVNLHATDGKYYEVALARFRKKNNTKCEQGILCLTKDHCPNTHPDDKNYTDADLRCFKYPDCVNVDEDSGKQKCLLIHPERKLCLKYPDCDKKDLHCSKLHPNDGKYFDRALDKAKDNCKTICPKGRRCNFEVCFYLHPKDKRFKRVLRKERKKTGKYCKYGSRDCRNIETCLWMHTDDESSD